MTNVIVTQTDVNPLLSVLDAKLDALADGAGTTGELIDDFALTMCKVFDRKDANGNVLAKWFTLVGKEQKPINQYRIKFNKVFESKTKVDKATGNEVRRFEDATIRSYWLQVKKASGKQTQAKVVSGEVNVDQKTLEDLKTAISRILNAEGDADGKFTNFSGASEIKGLLVDAFVSLGGKFQDGKPVINVTN